MAPLPCRRPRKKGDDHNNVVAKLQKYIYDLGRGRTRTWTDGTDGTDGTDVDGRDGLDGREGRGQTWTDGTD